MPGSGRTIDRILLWLIAFLAISAAYLYTFPQANIFYAVIVFLHGTGGLLAVVVLVAMLVRVLRSGSLSARAGWLLVAAGGVLGLILIKTGTPRTAWNKLYLHIALSVAGVGFLLASRWAVQGSSEARPIGSQLSANAIRIVLIMGLLAGVG